MWMVVKVAWVVVKKGEWWLRPTTSDQCGQNPVHCTCMYLFDYIYMYSKCFVLCVLFLRVAVYLLAWGTVFSTFSMPTPTLSGYSTETIAHCVYKQARWIVWLYLYTCTLYSLVPRPLPFFTLFAEKHWRNGEWPGGKRLGQTASMYRIHHEVEVSTGFTHRGPEARGYVNPVETEPSDVTDLYHGLASIFQ